MRWAIPKMAQDCLYVEVSVEDFMEKFLPINGKIFDKREHDTTIDTTCLAVSRNEEKDQRAWHKVLVSKASDILCIALSS